MVEFYLLRSPINGLPEATRRGAVYPQVKKNQPIVLTGTINNPFTTEKPATNGNHRLCLKPKPQVKCH